MEKTIVFTGGGTLGHVMPNLYLIDELKSKYNIVYMGGSGIERGRVKDGGVEYIQIRTIKLVRGKIFQNLKIPFVLFKAFIQCKKELRRLRPDLIFSKGGYVSLPVCMAARSLRIPIVAHESDYSFGLANKIILKLCDTMCVNFKHLEKKNKKIIYTGPILSREYENTDPLNLHIDKSKPTILVVCGSLGSKYINDLIYATINDLLKCFNIVHLTGVGNQKYPSFDNYIAMETTDNIIGLYNSVDVVIGRSGAGVSAECYYKRKPMLLIPLEKASRGDQLQNAKYYENRGVAKILHECKLNPKTFVEGIAQFMSDIQTYIDAYNNCENVNGRLKTLDIINNKIDKKISS